jgi:hypothetical protein
MARKQTAGRLLALALSLALLPMLLLAACATPAPSGEGNRPSPGGSTVAVRFAIYTGPPGFRLPEQRQELPPGQSAVVGTAPLDLDIVASGLSEQALRQALTVAGADLAAEPRALPGGQGLMLQVGPGKGGDQVTVSVNPGTAPPAVLTLRRAEPAAVTVEYQQNAGWQTVTLLNGHVSPGPAVVRLTFSKPVRRSEVEQALAGAQAALVRGLMQWPDERTLVWSLPQMPSRLDLLLGGAHDADGLPLPGGVPSLRVGEPPLLVLLDPATLREQPVAVLPPDIVSASLSADRAYLNLVAWKPGTSHWDWQTTDLYLPLASPALKPGRVEGPQPRLTGELQSWVVNPQGTLVAGFRRPTRPVSQPPGLADLVVRDLRGGREQVIPAFANHASPAVEMPYLAWSADGMRVLALSDREGAGAEVALVDLATLQRSVVAQGLPVQAAGTRLAWSAGGQWLLAGSLLVDLQTGTYRALPGDPALARGAWEPVGARLLYTARDWGEILLVDPAGGETVPMGPGLLVDWAEDGKAALIRWPASGSRYVPPGG